MNATRTLEALAGGMSQLWMGSPLCRSNGRSSCSCVCVVIVGVFLPDRRTILQSLQQTRSRLQRMHSDEPPRCVHRSWTLGVLHCLRFAILLFNGDWNAPEKGHYLFKSETSVSPLADLRLQWPILMASHRLVAEPSPLSHMHTCTLSLLPPSRNLHPVLPSSS